MPLPTPQSAAQARNDGGWSQGLVHNFLTHAGAPGALYNLINSITHAAQGTTGQWGPAPTLLGKIASAFSGNPTNAPPATAVNGGANPLNNGYQAPAGSALSGPGFVNAYPGGFGNFGQLPGEISAGGPVAGFDSRNGQPVYNARGVIPNNGPMAGGMSPQNSALSFWANAFPGSALARFAPSANPYDPNASGAPAGHSTALSPFLASLMADTRMRNIA